MDKQKIPAKVKQQADEIVVRFNETEIRDPRRYYLTRYRSAYLYLDRYYRGRPSHICRLTYTGDLDHWEFAIYKYSSERYDPDDWLIPGMEHLDGTIEGAMRCGLEAYQDLPERHSFLFSLLRPLIRRFL